MGKTSFLCQPRGRSTAARGIDFQKPGNLERGWERGQLAITSAAFSGLLSRKHGI